MNSLLNLLNTFGKRKHRSDIMMSMLFLRRADAVSKKLKKAGRKIWQQRWLKIH